MFEIIYLLGFVFCYAICSRLGIFDALIRAIIWPIVLFAMILEWIFAHIAFPDSKDDDTPSNAP